MAARPEVLFTLFGALEGLEGVGPKTARAFEGLDITTPRDLLFHLPHGVIDRRRRSTLKGMDFPAIATVEVVVGTP